MNVSVAKCMHHNNKWHLIPVAAQSFHLDNIVHVGLASVDDTIGSIILDGLRGASEKKELETL